MAAPKKGVQQLPDKTAIIGRIPGYNGAIDSTKEFQNQLLKGITFIDLRPMTYRIGSKIHDVTDVKTSFQELTSTLKEPGLFQRDTTTSKKIYKGILERMKVDFGLSASFADIDMIRIVGANDSTFTETFSNSYDMPNGILSPYQRGASATGGLGAAMAKGLKSYSHADMMSLAGTSAQLLNNSVGAGAKAADIIMGALFGLNMAVPSMWQQSDYSSTLTLFIKLVAPVGTPECIRRNILEPVLHLLAAASPVTYSGIMYGFPLLWDIQAHGITNFRLGGIGAMSLMRGSFETTFSHLLQPTVMDVRLTLVPVLNDFAVQTSEKDGKSEGIKSIYTHPDALGVQNPSDIYRGTLNANVNESTGGTSGVGGHQLSVPNIAQVNITNIKL